MAIGDKYDQVEISSFIAAFGKEGTPARANRYYVEFSLPSGIDAKDQNVKAWSNTESEKGSISSVGVQLNSAGQLGVLCHSCTMPSRDLTPTQVSQYGPPHRMPTNVQYQPIQMSFYTDSFLSTRRFFEVWQTAAHTISTNSFNFISRKRLKISS